MAGHVFIRISIPLALLLAGCTQDVRDRPLDEIDLADTAAVRQIGRELSSADSLAFTTYAALHARSGGLCGNRRGDGKPPETVGEAIEAMRLRTAQRPPNLGNS